MARLTGIGVGGFKSIRNLQPLTLGPINVLIGANGAGKSNLISFLGLLNAIPPGKLQEYVGRAGGADALLHYGAKQTPALWASVGFEGKTGSGTYFFELASTATDSVIFSNEIIDCPVVKNSPPARVPLGSGHKESLLMPDEIQFQEIRELLADIQIFHFEDTSVTAAMRRRGYIEDNRHLRNDAGNLAAFLLGLRLRNRPDYQRIVTTIRQVAPFFDEFDLAPMANDTNSTLLNWRDRDSTHLFGPHQLSDGTLRAMAQITLLAQPEDELPAVIVLDEPEIGLHPHALEVLAALIKSASVHSPVILATQSVALVNQFEPEAVVTVTRENAQSRFVRQDSESLAVWLEDYNIGEIWEKNLIGGTPSA
jgi:predicted ATPase